MPTEQQNISDISYRNTALNEFVKDSLGRQNIAFIKNVLSQKWIDQILTELSGWAVQLTTEKEFKVLSQENAKLRLKVDTPQHTQADLDFRDGEIALYGLNYRFGNLYDPQLIKELPFLTSQADNLLQIFRNLYPQPFHFTHGDVGTKNLYIEFMHFPPQTGYVAPHTHSSIAQYGLEFNLIGVLSSRSDNYEAGGPVIHLKDQSIDVDQFTKSGDFYIFSNRELHEVCPIVSQNSNHIGRWIISYFWY